MERQFLCFLHGDDEAELLRRIDAVNPGLVVLPGSLFTTADALALLAAPAAFEPLQPVRSERRLYLVHRTASALPILLEQPIGPHAGRFALDVMRSELLELCVKPPHNGRLPPARLAAEVLTFQGTTRVKKSPSFGAWVGRVLRELEATYPRSSVELVHVAAGALSFCATGGQLTYLEEPLLPAPFSERSRQRQKERIPS